MSREEQLRIQALGAALSRRDWHATEQAYNAIRDEFDGRPSRSAATSDMAIAGDTQSDLSIAGSALVEDKAGASTVEPVAWQYRHQGIGGDRWSSWIDITQDTYERLPDMAEVPIERRPLYAAPATSPEPDGSGRMSQAQFDEELRKVNETWTACGAGSPEPDAVREAPEAFEARVIKTMREFLGDTAFEALTFLRWKDGIDIRMATNGALAFVKNIEAAALSRPAHGGWEALKSIADFCSGDDSSLGAIARLAEVRRIASDALARHDRGGDRDA